ncbi:hypothetical protein BS50DRAFT_31514 [Corynespora cassiicola Philippines]|uniref:Uncharacterized protein n=1 Tax=Corynespora cassiicola Philippines TaxID=1448308 RepID=A0A2T2PBN1_CORCC|nr:hypothetical protein BS50DRAFT_31514 [Corynespora cassiicola Philippines]
MRAAYDDSSSSEQPRVKRKFQPSITHFFARSDDILDDSDSDCERGAGPITRTGHHHQHHSNPRDRSLPQRSSLVPTVPGIVQADLLSVGMRIRKSVPEGYKTHKSAALPSISTTLAKSPNTIPNPPAGEYSVKLPREAVPDVYQHQRELLPFCGLHKIGGYAEQPVTNPHLYGGTNEHGERPINMFPLPAEAFSQPFSSQDSANSSISTDSLLPNPANPQKRSWDDRDSKPLNFNSNFLFAVPMKVSEDDVPVSPLSATPAQPIGALPQAALRPFAQPKTRRTAARLMDVDSAALFKETDIEMDLENAEQGDGRLLVGSSSDFGEAEFLVRPYREVEMGGV